MERRRLVARNWILDLKDRGDLRATHPHYVYTPQGKSQVLHNGGRLGWGSGHTGWDVIIVREGRIAALYVYLDEARIT